MSPWSVERTVFYYYTILESEKRILISEKGLFFLKNTDTECDKNLDVCVMNGIIIQKKAEKL
jgi:hypothetical protein